MPLAASLDFAAAAAARLGMGPGFTLSQVRASEAFLVPEAGSIRLEISALRNREATEIGIGAVDHGNRRPAVTLRVSTASEPLAALIPPSGGNPPEMPVAEFYERLNFHGPKFRVLASVSEIGQTHAVGKISVPGNPDGPEGSALDVLSLDGMMHICAYWALG